MGPGGEQVGVVKIEVALRLAQEADLDLVEVAPNSKPPVAKIMDYGKYKYEAAQKAKEARRNQANTILKEVRFRLKIDKHDYETKMKRAVSFLQAGDKVKAMILFRGREQSRPEQGVRLPRAKSQVPVSWKSSGKSRPHPLFRVLPRREQPRPGTPAANVPVASVLVMPPTAVGAG